ncbi:hypothetical protein EB796_009987 [Bugula neritina]|uniref:Uncharacterized protein n=1 Tax=Bugula neritina TaxID=10212 RepID=A0A7J7K0H1_BUGNE|nr:hypothetical protein EB796_009987 [Bugula neritina]
MFRSISKECPLKMDNSASLTLVENELENQNFNGDSQHHKVCDILKTESNKSTCNTSSTELIDVESLPNPLVMPTSSLIKKLSLQ